MAYTTLSKVKQYLGIKYDTEDALIESLIISAQGLIESETHRLFEVTLETTRFFDAEKDVEDATLHLDTDLLSVTTLTNGDGVVIPAASYKLYPINDSPKFAIKLLGSGGYSWTYITDPEGAISIKGYWGYSLTPPQDIIHLTNRLTGFFYRQKDAQIFDTAGADEVKFWMPSRLPTDVLAVLARYTRVL